MLIYTLKSKNGKIRISYPEGERLLEEWRNQELEEIRNNADFEKEETEIRKSILDDRDDLSLPSPYDTIVGGFKINTDSSDEE